ncbi:hypothetical protein J3R74_001382 [Puniceicoccus vermicola]
MVRFVRADRPRNRNAEGIALVRDIPFGLCADKAEAMPHWNLSTVSTFPHPAFAWPHLVEIAIALPLQGELAASTREDSRSHEI